MAGHRGARVGNACLTSHSADLPIDTGVGMVRAMTKDHKSSERECGGTQCRLGWSEKSSWEH